MVLRSRKTLSIIKPNENAAKNSDSVPTAARKAIGAGAWPVNNTSAAMKGITSIVKRKANPPISLNFFILLFCCLLNVLFEILGQPVSKLEPDGRNGLLVESSPQRPVIQSVIRLALHIQETHIRRVAINRLYAVARPASFEVRRIKCLLKISASAALRLVRVIRLLAVNLAVGNTPLFIEGAVKPTPNLFLEVSAYNSYVLHTLPSFSRKTDRPPREGAVQLRLWGGLNGRYVYPHRTLVVEALVPHQQGFNVFDYRLRLF